MHFTVIDARLAQEGQLHLPRVVAWVRLILGEWRMADQILCMDCHCIDRARQKIDPRRLEEFCTICAEGGRDGS